MIIRKHMRMVCALVYAFGSLNAVHVSATEQVHASAPMLTEGKAESNQSPLTKEVFNKNYAKLNRPSIAIYVNREFTGEVREWSATKREFSQGQPLDENGNKKQAVVTTTQDRRHLEERPRNPPSELELWAFEEAFFQPFLDTGARLVDRAVMLRLMSAQSDQSKEYETVKLKKIEMDALSSFAEIFVEVLIAEDPSSHMGYQFRAKATEVSTAQVMANVTSQGIDKLALSTNDSSSYQAGADGYVQTSASGQDKAKMKVVAEKLAYLLMSELSEYWAARNKIY